VPLEIHPRSLKIELSFAGQIDHVRIVSSNGGPAKLEESIELCGIKNNMRPEDVFPPREA
jgi:hypothetical protein